MAPCAVTVTTTGKMPRARSGPPVATSSSAASISASTATRIASSCGQPGPPALLQRVLGGLRSRARRLVVLLLPPAAGGVVVEEPSLAARVVVAAEERHHDEPLHRQREVRADHLGEPVRLALEGQPVARELLVVLELELEQPHDLDGLAGRARDRDRGEVVGGEDLLHLRVGDRVPRGGAAVARHHDAVGEPQAEDGGPLRRPRRALLSWSEDGSASGCWRRSSSTKLGSAPNAAPDSGSSTRSVTPRPSGRRTSRTPRRSPPGPSRSRRGCRPSPP